MQTDTQNQDTNKDAPNQDIISKENQPSAIPTSTNATLANANLTNANFANEALANENLAKTPKYALAKSTLAKSTKPIPLKSSKLSLKSKLFCSFLCVIAFVIVATLALNATFSTHTSTNTKSTKLQSAYFSIQALALGIEADISSIAKSLSTLDKNDVLAQRQILSQALAQSQNQINQKTHKMPYLSAFVTYEEDGNTLIESTSSKTISSPSWDSAQGFRTRSWYVQTKQTFELKILPSDSSPNTTQNPTSQNPTPNDEKDSENPNIATATMPLIINGKFSGVVGVSFDLGALDFGSLIDFSDFGAEVRESTDTILLLDSALNLIASSTKSSSKSSYEGVKKALQKAMQDDSSDLAKQGAFSYKENGKTLKARYAKLPFGWNLVSITTPNPTALPTFDSLQGDFIPMIIIALAMLALGLILSYFAINSSIKPVEDMKRGIDEFFAFLRDERSDWRSDEKSDFAEIRVGGVDDFSSISRAIAQHILLIRKSLDNDTKAVEEIGLLAREITQGNLSHRITKSYPNPNLQQIATTINTMLDSIESKV
ncbi:hypothetical protein, partial [Helicobacter sp. T3_23-1056]